MEIPYVVATLALLTIILFFVGGALTERCVDISGCKQCWKTTPVVVESPLCPNSSACVASPRAQQNNAIVDAIVCGCAKTKAADYQDQFINSRIEDTLKEYTGYEIAASQICEQPGLLLVKSSYD
jgi:hypothetical protein